MRRHVTLVAVFVLFSKCSMAANVNASRFPAHFRGLAINRNFTENVNWNGSWYFHRSYFNHVRCMKLDVAPAGKSFKNQMTYKLQLHLQIKEKVEKQNFIAIQFERNSFIISSSKSRRQMNVINVSVVNDAIVLTSGPFKGLVQFVGSRNSTYFNAEQDVVTKAEQMNVNVNEMSSISHVGCSY